MSENTMDISDYIDSIRESLETVELDFSLHYNVDLEEIKNNKSVIETREKYAKTLLILFSITCYNSFKRK